jgi:hypothetical protein
MGQEYYFLDSKIPEFAYLHHLFSPGRVESESQRTDEGRSKKD